MNTTGLSATPIEWPPIQTTIWRSRYVETDTSVAPGYRGINFAQYLVFLIKNLKSIEISVAQSKFKSYVFTLKLRKVVTMLPFHHMMVHAQSMCYLKQMLSRMIREIPHNIPGVFIPQNGFCNRTLFCLYPTFDKIVNFFATNSSASDKIRLFEFA